MRITKQLNEQLLDIMCQVLSLYSKTNLASEFDYDMETSINKVLGGSYEPYVIFMHRIATEIEHVSGFEIDIDDILLPNIHYLNTFEDVYIYFIIKMKQSTTPSKHTDIIQKPKDFGELF